MPFWLTSEAQMGKIIGVPQINKLLDTTDKECYNWFKFVLEAKYALWKGERRPESGFRVVFKAIHNIEKVSNNLKYYKGFIQAKEEITDKYYKYISASRIQKKVSDHNIRLSYIF